MRAVTAAARPRRRVAPRGSRRCGRRWSPGTRGSASRLRAQLGVVVRGGHEQRPLGLRDEADRGRDASTGSPATRLDDGHPAPRGQLRGHRVELASRRGPRRTNVRSRRRPVRWPGRAPGVPVRRLRSSGRRWSDSEGALAFRRATAASWASMSRSSWSCSRCWPSRPMTPSGARGTCLGQQPVALVERRRTSLSASIQGGAAPAFRSMWKARPISPARGSSSSDDAARPWPGRPSKSPRSCASRMRRSVSDSQVGAMDVTPSASRRMAGRGGSLARAVHRATGGITGTWCHRRGPASVRPRPARTCAGLAAQPAAIAADVAGGHLAGWVDIHERRAAVGGAEEVATRGGSPESSLGGRSLTERHRGVM